MATPTFPECVVTADLEEFFIDKDTALPLANGTLTFYQDQARNIGKEVFEISGNPGSYTYNSLGNVVTLSTSGTVQDSSGANQVIYYYPFDNAGNQQLYYVVCQSEQGVMQFTREAWPNPSSSTTPPVSTSSSNAQNQISNPNFTNVFINTPIASTFTFTSAANQVVALGPDWNLVVTGTGTVTVQQIAITGANNVPQSPPYVIDITVSSGITICNVIQNFDNNSGLWASTGSDNIYLNGSFVAKNVGIGSVNLVMKYTYTNSTPSSDITIVNGSLTASFTQFTGSSASPIPSSTDVIRGSEAFVGIYLSFPASSHIQFSAVQVIPSQKLALTTIPDDLNSSNRGEAYQGDYYIPNLSSRQACSFLVGWDFPLNPFQFATSGSLNTFATYFADQTIGATSGAIVTWSVDPITNGILFNSASTTNAFYILQYLDGGTVKDILTNPLSVNIFAYQNGVSGGPVTAKVYLYVGNSSAIFPNITGGMTVGTVNADGTFNLTASNWSLVARSGLNTPSVNLGVVQTNDEINNGENDFGFTGWEIIDPPTISNTNKFAMVVTFSSAAAFAVTVNSISLVPGAIPARPLVLTPDQVLRQCQYYYEKSYESGTFAPTSTSVGAITENQVAFAAGNEPYQVQFYAQAFCVRLKQVKRPTIATPLVSIYSTLGIPSFLTAILYKSTGIEATNTVALSNWTLANIGDQSFSFQPTNYSSVVTTSSNTTGNTNPGAYLIFHYTVSARIGEVT